MQRTVILLVLDSVGIGALPDATLFGDEGSNTLGHVLDQVPDLRLPNLNRIGLGQILPHTSLPTLTHQVGFFGRGMTRSQGKDTITGHWELMGIVLEQPFQTFPLGFPKHGVTSLERSIGRKLLGNKVSSGTDIIAELGREHEVTGSPILYTSADSVMQIAAHEDVIPLQELYDICLSARQLMQGNLAVARIIARPFTGTWPYQRTANRHDYAVVLPRPTALNILADNGLATIGIGKICDIFGKAGLTQCITTKSNTQGQDMTLNTYLEGRPGLIFTNLVDFDSLFGHRNDFSGYADALREFDAWLGQLIPKLRGEDWLVVVADHGCDPTFPGTDHTREYVPILAYSPSSPGPKNVGDRESLTDVGATILALFGLQPTFPGVSFKADLESQ